MSPKRIRRALGRTVDRGHTGERWHGGEGQPGRDHTGERDGLEDGEGDARPWQSDCLIQTEHCAG